MSDSSNRSVSLADFCFSTLSDVDQLEPSSNACTLARTRTHTQLYSHLSFPMFQKTELIQLLLSEH